MPLKVIPNSVIGKAGAKWKEIKVVLRNKK